MQHLVNYARGWVRLQAVGAFPERLLNLCAQNEVTFWAVEWRDGQTLALTVLQGHLSRVEALAPRAGCELTVEGQAGVPSVLHRFRKRYGFLAGLFLSVLLVCLGSRFVLTVEVTGNQAVPQAAILSQLRREGLRPGVYGPHLDTKQIALNTQLALEELAWVSVNLYGTRAQVVVRETQPPPELPEREGTSDILARAGGLILEINAAAGQAKVKPGDTVAKGDVLISGTVTMEGPQYSDIPPRYLHVHAVGQVWARTWRTVQGTTPLNATTKQYTGKERSFWSVTVLDRHINFFGNSSIYGPEYDKIRKTYTATLPKGQVLPFSITRERVKRWQPTSVSLDLTAAQQMLEQQLTEELKRQVGEDGQVVCVDWSARVADGFLTVTGVAECREQIGENTAGLPVG